MAEKLQKTLQGPGGISSVGNPVGPDTSKATFINSIGAVAQGGLDLATSLQTTSRQAELREGLLDTKSDFDAIANGAELTAATDRIKRLKRARDQGRLDEGTLNIELEAELKRVIGTSPGLSQALRRTAFEELGFDPTGSMTQSIMGKSGRFSPKKALTKPEKWMQDAVALNQLRPEVSVDTLFNLTAKASIMADRASIVKSQATIGQATGQELRSARLATTDIDLLQVMDDVLRQVENGGVSSPEVLMTAVLAQQQRTFIQMSNDARETNMKFDPVAARAEIQAQWAGIADAIANGSLETVMTRKMNELSLSSTEIAYDLFGPQMVVSKLGPAFATAYVDFLSRAKDEKQLEFLKGAFPGFARLIANDPAITRMSSEAFNRVMGVAPASGGGVTGGVGEVSGGAGQPKVQPDQGTPEEKSLWEDVTSYMMIGSETDVDVRNKVNDFLTAKNQPFKKLSFYARPGVRGRLTPQEVEDVTVTFQKSNQVLIPRMAAFMAINRDYFLTNKGGTFSIEKAATTAGPAAGGLAQGVPASLQLDVDRLNVMNKMVKNGYSKDVGEAVENFVDRKILQINNLSKSAASPGDFNDAIRAFAADPNSQTFGALELIAPDLAADILQRSLRGASGGD